MDRLSDEQIAAGLKLAKEADDLKKPLLPFISDGMETWINVAEPMYLAYTELHHSRAENERLRGALSFYAWAHHDEDAGAWYERMECEEGDIATKALEGGGLGHEATTGKFPVVQMEGG